MVRHTHPSLRVLALFCDELGRDLSGADIAKQTGIASGTLYPILIRYEEAGLLKSKWENVDPVEAGRPRRRFYRLTAQGQREAAAALSVFSKPMGGVAWA